MHIQEEISLENNQNRLGKEYRVLIDRIESDYFIGRTEFDSPEVDNEVLIEYDSCDLEIGEFYTVRINSVDSFDLFAELV